MSDDCLAWMSDLELTVWCGGRAHGLRLHHGQLELCDHPDLEAELAMVGLGGPEPACVSHYHLWNDAVGDGGFLGEWIDETKLNGAWFSWLAMALERMRTEGFHEFLRRLPPARARRMGEFLHHFPMPWIDRAAALVNLSLFEPEAGMDQAQCDLAPDQLSAATANRLRRAFVDGVGGRQLAVGTAALIPLTISIGKTPAVSGALRGPGRGVGLQVDRRWLHRVWAAEAATIDGRLVLAMEPDGQRPSDRATATTVAWRTDPVGGHVPSLETTSVRLDSVRSDGRWLGEVSSED